MYGLVYAEINEETGEMVGKPLKTYIKNKSIESVNSYMETNHKIRLQHGKLSEIQRNQAIRFNSLAEDIYLMGYVHRSELDKIIEKKLIEVHQRVKAQYYYNKMIVKPFRKMMVWFGLKLSVKMLKDIS